jgi:N-terminal acetyltransferase B complex non-catalytic subunit
MASKPEGQEVRLRNRVRGFLDQVQDSTGKRIQKACADLASEFPNAHLAKAALSIAYIKLGSIQQSVGILEEAVKKSNEWILDQGSIYYYTAAMKSIERMDLVEQVWEKAAAADKKSVAHLEKLFSACLRSGNSARQISSAMELWKLTNDDKYLMWSIVARAQPELKPDIPRTASIAAASPIPELPTSSSGEPSALEPNKVLQLSHMMFNMKFVTPGKVTKHLDLDFMLRVLIQQGQCDTALEMIRSDLAKRLYGIGFQRLSEEAGILLRFSRLDEARALYETLLTEHNSDEWSWYLGYFDSLFGAQKTPGALDATKLSAARSLIKSLQSKTENGIKLRGPYLAELELEQIASKENCIFPLLVSFFHTFSTKPSCYRDMLPYIKSLTSAEQLQLIEQLKDTVQLDASKLTSETSLSTFGTICTYKSLVRTVMHHSMTEEQRETEIQSLWALYNAARKADHPREASERFCADDLLIMIAHYHCDRFIAESEAPRAADIGYRVNTASSVSSSALRHLVSAAVALEHGVAHSKWNFQFRLLLNEVYIALGSVRSCMDQFDAVDVKHIQLDSVGYLFADAWVRYASLNDLNKLVKRSTLFYDDSRRSTADYAFEAFQKGAYHKVKEVMNFTERLNNSVHRHALRLEQLLLLVADASSLPASLSLFTSFDPLQRLPTTLDQVQKYHKNHDGEAMDWWDAEPPKFKHIELPSGSLRSTCYPDANQDVRLLLNSLLVQTVCALAPYQAPAPGEKPGPAPAVALDVRLAPIAKQFEEALDLLKDSPHETLVWSFIKHSFQLVQSMFALSPNLTTDKPDAANVNSFKAAVDALGQGFEQLNAALNAADGGKIVASNNVPLLTSFLVRSLVTLPMIVPLLPKLLPGKARPKTPDEVKAQTSLLKSSIREIGEITRKQLAHLELLLQKESTESSNFETDPAPFTSQIPETVNPKLLEKVLAGLSYSRRDTHQTLLTLVQNKIRDFKTL